MHNEGGREMRQGLNDMGQQSVGSEPVRTGWLGWVIARVTGEWPLRRGKARQLQMLETLPLGGKRQLILVSCAGELYLVGAGADGVQSIVKAGSGGAGAEFERLGGPAC